MYLNIFPYFLSFANYGKILSQIHYCKNSIRLLIITSQDDIYRALMELWESNVFAGIGSSVIQSMGDRE